MVIVNYESGAALPAVRRGLAGGRRRPRWWWWTTGRATARSTGSGRRYPDLEVVIPGQNLGYGAAANRGVAATDALTVLVCNPDLEVGPGTLAALARALADRPAVGPGRTVDPHLGRGSLPVGPAVPLPDRRRRPRPAWASSPRTTGSPVPTSTTARAAPGGPGGGRLGLGGLLPGPPFGASSRSAGSTSPTSCTPRTSTCAGGWPRPAGRRPTCPAAEVTHRQGVSTDHHPYRMILEHHRSLFRFAGPVVSGLAAGPAAAGRGRARGPGLSGLPGPDHPGGDRCVPGARPQAVGCPPIMASNSTGKTTWVERAATTGGGRTYRGQMPVNWYASLAVICIVGLLLIGFSRYQRTHQTASSAGPPTTPQTVVRRPGHRHLRHHAAQPAGQHQHRQDRSHRQRQRRGDHRTEEQLRIR